MTQVAPAFWVKYRGEVDPQKPFSTTYTYAATFLTYNNPNSVIYTATIAVTGPPQLTKKDYMEVRWSPMIGLNQVVMSRNGTTFYATNGAEQGFRDEGQFNVVNGGVQNQ